MSQSIFFVVVLITDKSSAVGFAVDYAPASSSRPSKVRMRLTIDGFYKHKILQFSHFDERLGVAIRNKSTHFETYSALLNPSPHSYGIVKLGIKPLLLLLREGLGLVVHPLLKVLDLLPYLLQVLMLGKGQIFIFDHGLPICQKLLKEK